MARDTGVCKSLSCLEKELIIEIGHQERFECNRRVVGFTIHVKGLFVHENSCTHVLILCPLKPANKKGHVIPWPELLISGRPPTPI